MNDKTNPFLLPGVVTKTGPNDYFPISQQQLIKFNNGTWSPMRQARRHPAERLGRPRGRGFGPAPRASPMSDLTAQLNAAMPFGGFLGLEVLAASAEEVRARLDWAEELCTAGGILHGGALMGLADSTGGFCAFLNLPEGATGTATIESKTNFFAAVREGWVEAVSRPLHVGKTTIVVDTDLLDSTGRRVARVTQTQAVPRR